MTIQCLDCAAVANGSPEYVESLREIHALAQPGHQVMVAEVGA